MPQSSENDVLGKYCCVASYLDIFEGHL